MCIEIVDFLTEYNDGTFLDNIFNNKVNIPLETKTQLHLDEAMYYYPLEFPELKNVVLNWFEYYKKTFMVKNPNLPDNFYYSDILNGFITIKYLDNDGFVLFDEPVSIKRILSNVLYAHKYTKIIFDKSVIKDAEYVLNIYIQHFQKEHYIVFSRDQDIIKFILNTRDLKDFIYEKNHYYNILNNETYVFPYIMAFVINSTGMNFLSSDDIFLIQPYHNINFITKYKISKYSSSSDFINTNFLNLTQHWIYKYLNENIKPEKA